MGSGRTESRKVWRDLKTGKYVTSGMAPATRGQLLSAAGRSFRLGVHRWLFPKGRPGATPAIREGFKRLGAAITAGSGRPS